VFTHNNWKYTISQGKTEHDIHDGTVSLKAFRKRGEGIVMILPMQQCLDNKSRNIWQGASDVLVEIQNTTAMLRVSITWCFEQGLDWKITRDTKEHFQIISERKVKPNTTRSVLAESQGCRR
jgi:hypothetical protein